MSLFTILIIFFGIVVIISGFRMVKYLLSVKKANSENLFVKIAEWYILAKAGNEPDMIKKTEKIIDEMFENKLLKTSLLHFHNKFIENYFRTADIKYQKETSDKEFEKISGIGLDKSRKSLKFITSALGYNFYLENYSFLNYWYILRGNYILFKAGKKDPQGKVYTWEDIEEPYKILEFYFKEKVY